MKKRKIKWGNVIEAIIFLFCIGLMIHDIIIVIYALLHNQIAMFTYFGLATFIFAGGFAYVIYEDFKEQTKNIHSYQPKHAKDIKRK